VSVAGAIQINASRAGGGGGRGVSPLSILKARNEECAPAHPREDVGSPAAMLRPRTQRPRRHRRAAKEPEGIPASHGAAPSCQDALRLRAGSLERKEVLRERRHASTAQGARGSLEVV
jgi:hypothetical protein